jgi:hypothetical protein
MASKVGRWDVDVERKIGSGCPHYWARGRTDALLTLDTFTAARLGAFDRATVYICNLHCMIKCCAYAALVGFRSTTRHSPITARLHLSSTFIQGLGVEAQEARV